MWEVIKPIIHLLCNLVLIFLYGIPAIMVGIYQIKEEYESTRWGIFGICWGVMVLLMATSSLIDFYFF